MTLFTLGHAASADLYSAFNGNPINFFDADGRLGKNASISYGGTYIDSSGTVSYENSYFQNQAVSTENMPDGNGPHESTEFAGGELLDSLALSCDLTRESVMASWTIGVHNLTGEIFLYPSGWSTGNQYVTITAEVGLAATITGTALTASGLYLECMDYKSGQEPQLQFQVNTSVSLAAFMLGQSSLMIGDEVAGGPIGISLGVGNLAGKLLNQVPGQSAAWQALAQPFTDYANGVNNNQINVAYPNSFESIFQQNNFLGTVNSVANPFPPHFWP